MPFISIIIVGYNSKTFLEDCLLSVYSQTFKDFEIIFVDNDSSDGTAGFMPSLYPDIKIIKNTANLGFSRANNQGIKISNGEYILTLNADVVLEKDFLRNIIKGVELYREDSNVGMFSGKILRKDRKTIDSTGLVLTRFRRFYDRRSGEDDDGRFNKIEEIFGPCAAAALYKRKMLEDIKANGEYFDEDFFVFVEDVDLAWRAQRRGWKALYVPDASCYHARHSNGYDKSFIQYYSFRNRYCMLLKNERFNLLTLLAIFLYDMPRFIYMLFTNKMIVKALVEMKKLRKSMLYKRLASAVNNK